MGLDILTAKFLIGEMRRGVDFSRTLTLGRQEVYMSRPQYKSACSDLNLAFSDVPLFADGFFVGLGSERLAVLDASSYEGASLLHDLNQPLSSALLKDWSCVFDGGTLEHVFNFPQAIKTCMQLVKVGGHFISISPWNNWGGHGFYQFSPELFYRIFSQDNGFKIERILINHNGSWYSVVDPMSLGSRVEFYDRNPSLLYVSARRLKSTPIFYRWPQQSDYSKAWSSVESAGESPQGLASRLKLFLIAKFGLVERLQFFWRQQKMLRAKQIGGARWARPIPQSNGVPI